MQLIIDDSYKLYEIQNEFNKHFPYLRLEFFKYDPIPKRWFLKENLIKDTTRTLAEVRHLHFDGALSINGNKKVSTLEKQFRDNFGINIQIFRKSANTWLQTLATDEWTLAEQNKLGEEMDIIEQYTTGADDYHEQL